MACGKFICLALIALLLLAACSHEDAQPPRGGLEIGADTTWLGDSVINF